MGKAYLEAIVSRPTSAQQHKKHDSDHYGTTQIRTARRCPGDTDEMRSTTNEKGSSIQQHVHRHMFKNVSTDAMDQNTTWRPHAMSSGMENRADILLKYRR